MIYFFAGFACILSLHTCYILVPHMYHLYQHFEERDDIDNEFSENDNNDNDFVP